MADTQRTRSALLALFADNTAGAISPQDIRDLVVSLLRRSMRVVTSHVTLGPDDDYILVDPSGGSVTVTLPDPATCPRKRYTIKSTYIGPNQVRVAYSGGIDSTVYTVGINDNTSFTVVSDGTGWFFTNRSVP